MGVTINMKNCIDIEKLQRNSLILLETKETCFEITVTGPKSKSVVVHGGLRFISPTKAKISEPIKRGEPVKFLYNDKDALHGFHTSEVISATIFAADKSWHYDAIEARKENEDTNQT